MDAQSPVCLPADALPCAHKLLSVLLPLADYIKHMDDAELASVLPMIKKQRKKLKAASQYLCLEPCGSPFCELCGVMTDR